MKQSKLSIKNIILSSLYALFLLLALTPVAAQPLNDPTASTGGDTIFLVCLCTCYLIIFILMLVSSVWIYRDAKKLNVEHPLLWSVLSFFFFPIVLIIYYLVVRKEAKQKLTE